MLKRFTAILFLTTAFTIVMAHSIVPHHHHEEETTQHQDKDHDNDSPLSDLFSHFQHFTPTNEITLTHHADFFKHISNPQIQKDFLVAFAFHFFKSCEQVPFRLIGIPDHPKDNIPVCYLSTFSLRGPPAFSA